MCFCDVCFVVFVRFANVLHEPNPVLVVQKPACACVRSCVHACVGVGVLERKNERERERVREREGA